MDVASDVVLQEGVVMVTDPGSASEVMFRVAGGSVQLGKNGIFLGTFIAPDAHIDIHEDATLTGMLYGSKIQIKKNVSLAADPALSLFIDWFVP